jgi:hypothetical protein
LMIKTKGLILEREVLECRSEIGCTTIPQAHYSHAFSATPQLELNSNFARRVQHSFQMKHIEKYYMVGMREGRVKYETFGIERKWTWIYGQG